MIRLEVELEIRHRGVMNLCAIEDKTAVVVASYPGVSRNPLHFKGLERTFHLMLCLIKLPSLLTSMLLLKQLVM